MKISIGLICSTTILLGLWPFSVQAEISYPYVVDEKPQVLFGDSVRVAVGDGLATTTYYGLENYEQDYVGDYAHINFTYTHTIDNYASYPPIIYVTSINPRQRSAYGLEKAADYAFFLRDKWYVHPNLTDWYSYDIQFDSTGYTIVVKQGGQIEIVNEHRSVPNQEDSDWVALANHFPTFGAPNANSFAFTPVPVKASGNNLDPVIIIPGIMGSAKKNGELVLDPILHTYDDLVDTLLANGYEENVTLFKFPYEWRDSNTLTANLLDDKIEQVKQTCGCNKVDLVAHSMGGLVARAYIQSADYDQDVDQLIFLGTPHKGSPKAYLQWEAGRFPSSYLLPDLVLESLFQAEALKNGYSTIFNYVRNRPILSVQELLPTFNYLVDKSSATTRSYPDNYPRNYLLENLNANISKLLGSGVKITNITGNSGENKTIEKITVVPTAHSGLWEHGEPDGYYAGIGDHGIQNGVGDNTVPTYSATLDSVTNKEVVASHNRIPTVAEGEVYKVLTSKDATTLVDRGFQLSPRMLIVQLLSPIDVVVTAPDGKKIGKNFQTGSEYNEIPGAFYSGFQTDQEYVTILNPLDGEYKVEVQGTDKGGSYGVLTSYASEEFSTTTRTDGVTKPSQITTLEVTVDSENPGELATERVVTTETLANDINQAYQLGWIKDAKTYTTLNNYASSLIKLESLSDSLRNGKPRVVLKKVFDILAAKTMAQELRAYRGKKITEQGYNLIKQDLEYLINHN